MESADFLERVARSDGVDQEEALSRTHVLLTHGTARNAWLWTRTSKAGRKHVPVFLLAGGIQDVEERNLIVDHALLTVRI